MSRMVYTSHCRKHLGSGYTDCPRCCSDGYDYFGGQCHDCYGTDEVTFDECGGSGEIELGDD